MLNEVLPANRSALRSDFRESCEIDATRKEDGWMTRKNFDRDEFIRVLLLGFRAALVERVSSLRRKES